MTLGYRQLPTVDLTAGEYLGQTAAGDDAAPDDTLFGFGKLVPFTPGDGHCVIAFHVVASGGVADFRHRSQTAAVSGAAGKQSAFVVPDGDERSSMRYNGRDFKTNQAIVVGTGCTLTVVPVLEGDWTEVTS